MDTADRFRRAIEQRDLDAATRLLAPDIRLYSPVKFTPFAGAAEVGALLRVLLRTFEDFRYTGRLHGAAERADGRRADSHILVFRATVAGRQIHGVDLLQLDDQGAISELTVMVRPLSAVTALGEAVAAGLAADGLLPPGPAGLPRT